MLLSSRLCGVGPALVVASRSGCSRLCCVSELHAGRLPALSWHSCGCPRHGYQVGRIGDIFTVMAVAACSVGIIRCLVCSIHVFPSYRYILTLYINIKTRLAMQVKPTPDPLQAGKCCSRLPACALRGCQRERCVKRRATCSNIAGRLYTKKTSREVAKE